MDPHLVELCSFLHDKNPSVRQIALENLLVHTPKESPNRNVFFQGLQGGTGLAKPKDNTITRDLKLLCRDQLATAHDAFRALINLTDSSQIIGVLSEPDFLTFLVSYIIHPPSVLADLAAMLLSNLTANATTCAILVELRIPIIPEATLKPVPFYPPQSRCATSISPVPYPPEEAVRLPALPFLVQAFAEGATLEKDPSKRLRKGELHFLSSVLANISVTQPGRSFFITPRPSDPLLLETADTVPLEYPLSQLISFTEHADVIRRGGVASTIKNCAFLVAAHPALLADEQDQINVPPSTNEAPGLNILPSILLPLAGPEEFEVEDIEKLPPPLQFLPETKRREIDPTLRLTHIETLLLLCTTRAGRERLRSSSVYEVVRTAHLVENVDKVSEHIERLVVLLKGDEQAEIREVDGVEVDMMPTDARATAVSVASAVDSDEEDGRIEEM